MADFQKKLEKLEEFDVEVVALSVDKKEAAEEIKEKFKIDYHILYGVDAQDIRRATGCYINEEEGYLHASGFILKNGKIDHVTYSSGPLGRLDPSNVADLIEHSEDQ